MGYKILDVKTEIHEDVERYMQNFSYSRNGTLPPLRDLIQTDILDIVDKHFEKIER